MDPSEDPARQDDGNREGGYDGLYTGMAGLVLLHPFLSMLFTQLNWVEKGRFQKQDLPAARHWHAAFYGYRPNYRARICPGNSEAPLWLSFEKNLFKWNLNFRKKNWKKPCISLQL